MTDASPTAALGPSSAYDRVEYVGHPFEQTHPDRLATIASLHGLQSAPVPACRVLELGCADGGNLIPMAYQWPDSEFIGVDLNERAIRKGLAAAAGLGLRNLKLLHLDLLEIAAEFGQFDYIIAHGVYSWVPAPVRTKILAIFRHNMAPAGVAYVSYNAHPGSYLRDMARAMMLFHVRTIEEPQARVNEARSFFETLAEASNASELHGLLLNDQRDRLRRITDAQLYHDDLVEGARAFFLYQVAEDASCHGLQYLSDARFALPDLDDAPEVVAKTILQIPLDDAVRRDQYLDFIKGRSFRATLFCHQERSLDRRIAPHCIKAYHVAANVVPAGENRDPGAPGIGEFRTGKGGAVSIDHSLSKAALLHLGTIWPQAAGFPELVESAYALLGPAAAPPGDARRQADIEALMEVLLRLASAGPVALHLHPPRLCTLVGERPKASLLARQQAAESQVVTSLRHTPVMIEDDIARRLLVLADGTRSIHRIVRDLNTAVGDGKRPPITRKNVEQNLAMVARLGLLIA